VGKNFGLYHNVSLGKNTDICKQCLLSIEEGGRSVGEEGREGLGEEKRKRRF